MAETTITYDDFGASEPYDLESYKQKWITPFGLGEMEEQDTRTWENGVFKIAAEPFKTASDYQFYDHLKYYSQSVESFPLPGEGSVGVSASIKADTSGTVEGKIIEGSYVSSGERYSAKVLEGQQAAVVLCFTNIAQTGQLFDWFVSRNKAFCLAERLPSEQVGVDKIYTQIVGEHDIEPGFHDYGITVRRESGKITADFSIDGTVVESVSNVGIPLDKSGADYTGTYPSLGSGEPLDEQIGEFGVALGLFSLLDAFPFQHEGAPEKSVSIPVENRAFGQGVTGHIKNVTVTTVE